MQQIYTIPPGIIYTIDSYIPNVISLILAISLNGWFFSLFHWEVPFFDISRQTQKPLVIESNRVELAISRMQVQEKTMGKQYVVQLTEDELLHFWTTLEELDKNIEEQVSFELPSSDYHQLTVKLIGGATKKYKRWGQNFIFLLFLFGTLMGIYLVITEIWSLITYT
jgi:hypothetical protein